MKVSQQTYNHFLVVLLCFFITGLFFSNAILSISTLLFLGWIIINNYSAITLKKTTQQQKGLLILFSVYIIWSFWKSGNIENTIHIIISKLSILGLSITIPFISFYRHQLKQIFILLLTIIIGITFYDLWIYYTDIEIWKLAYTKGQVLPTFLHHVKFSFVIVSIICLLYIYKPLHKYFNTILIIYFVIFLHLLAVKSGLVLLYFSFIILIIQKIYQRKYIYLLLLIIPLLLINFNTNFKYKINYFKYDIAQLNTANVLDYSDARRIISYQTAWNIFKENKLLGTGLSNLKTETENYYKKKYNYFDTEKMMYIHNSYLHILAGTGIIGFTFFLSALLLILNYHLKTNKLIFYLNLCFWIICFWDALTEQLTGISLFFLLQIIKCKKE